MRRKIALIGTAKSRQHAPIDDESWEIWGVGARGEQISRATRWFEIHRLDGEPADWAAKWRADIRKFATDVELVMFYPEPDLGPHVTAYPHDRIIARFGSFFMSSSFAWMMALAIDEMRPIEQMHQWHERKGLDEIGIWGVDMEYGTEYKHQRLGFRHFFDLARSLGIEVARLASSGLAYEPVPYPFIQDDPLLNKLSLRKQQTRNSLEDTDGLIKKTRELLAANQGAIDEIEQIISSGTFHPQQRMDSLCRERANLLKTSANLSKTLVFAEGAFEEQSWLEDYLQA